MGQFVNYRERWSLQICNHMVLWTFLRTNSGQKTYYKMVADILHVANYYYSIFYKDSPIYFILNNIKRYFRLGLMWPVCGRKWAQLES